MGRPPVTDATTSAREALYGGTVTRAVATGAGGEGQVTRIRIAR